MALMALSSCLARTAAWATAKALSRSSRPFCWFEIVQSHVHSIVSGNPLNVLPVDLLAGDEVTHFFDLPAH